MVVEASVSGFWQVFIARQIRGDGTKLMLMVVA